VTGGGVDATDAAPATGPGGGGERGGAGEGGGDEQAARRRTTTVLLGSLALLGVVGFAVAGMALDGPRGFGARWGAWGLATGLTTAGLLLAPRSTARGGLLIIVVGAIAFRAVLVPAPVGSDDIYRFLWDGRVQAAGISPYAHPPSDTALGFLRDREVWPNINRPTVRTIYPPAAQATFLGAHLAELDTPQRFKLVPTAADVAAILLLIVVLRRAGRDPRWVVAYAWNPVTVLGFAHSGHIDSLVVALVLGAVLTWQRGWLLRTGLLLGLAASVKLFPLALLPAFARGPDGSWRWRGALGMGAVAAGVLALGYLPYLRGAEDVLGFLPGYLEQEGYTSGTRSILLRRLGLEQPWLPLLVGGLVLVAAMRSRLPAPTRAAWVMGAAIVIATPPYAWYAAPLIALAVAGGAGWMWPLLAMGWEAAYISLFFRPFDVRLSTHLRFAISLLAVGLLLAAIRSGRARRALLWQPPRLPGVSER
jgi:hypothetical protein